MNEIYKATRQCLWKTQLNLMIRCDSYGWACSDTDYRDSVWHPWEERIKKGHANEERSIEKRQKKWEKSKPSVCAKEYADYQYDWLIDEYWQISNLTNSMYAALVVSLWANVEACLKELIKICTNTLSSKIDSESNIKCKKIQKNNIYKFHIIKSFFENNLNINLQEFSNYETVNALRLLNNSYKHNNGYYKHKADNRDEQIVQELIDKWSNVKNEDDTDKAAVIEKDGKINYAKLSMKDLVIACSIFRKELIESIKTELTNRTKGDKE